MNSDNASTHQPDATRNEGVRGSNPRIGSTIPERHTPGAQHSPNTSTELQQRAVTAYRAGDTRRGERYLTDAWVRVLPAVQATIRKHVREQDLQADAAQGAFLKLWQAVRNWHDDRGPVDSAEAVCRWFAHKAALNVVEQRDRVHDHENATLDDSDTRDVVEFRAAEIRPSMESDDVALEEYAAYACERASSRRQGMLWAGIIRAVAAGHVEREAIGERLGIPAVSVRREIHHMRKVLDIRALDQMEEIVSWATPAADGGDGDGSLALFAFEYREIS